LKPLLLMEGICKAFGGTQALEEARFDLRAGEVHVLMGENGAGKSTLIKILAGAYRADRGQIYLDGKPVEITGPLDAQRLGIRVIYQEFNLIPGLTVAENLFLGEPPVRSGLVDRRAMRAAAQEALTRLGVSIDPARQVKYLSVAEQQMVEIARAVAHQVRILVLDEPTAALTQREAERLFDTIADLKRRGVGLIFISHRLDEVYRLADRITVMRDGRYVGTWEAGELPPDQLIRHMVGRELKEIFPKVEAPIGETLLSVRGLSLPGKFADVSFDVRRGEIVGLTGLMGAGRTEVVRTLFGAERKSAGEVYFEGRKVEIQSPSDAIALGWGLVPEDRKRQGIVPYMPVRGNILLTVASRLTRFGLLGPSRTGRVVDEFIQRLRVVTDSPQKKVVYLSGGNQQKVVLARWLATGPRLLILDEPTRGIDVGAKAEIHRLMGEYVRQGNAILMVSSELPEVLSMCDRVLVMHEGRLVRSFERGEATQEAVMRYSVGLGEGA
jgi:ABC-type sugar transport system ATPase subunit